MCNDIVHPKSLGKLAKYIGAVGFGRCAARATYNYYRHMQHKEAIETARCDQLVQEVHQIFHSLSNEDRKKVGLYVELRVRTGFNAGIKAGMLARMFDPEKI